MSTLLAKDINGNTVFPMSSDEREPVTFDFTPYLAAGETISSATAEFIRVASGLDVPAPRDGNPIIDGTSKLVTQWVKDPPAEPNGGYRLELRAVTSAGRVREPAILVPVPH